MIVTRLSVLERPSIDHCSMSWLSSRSWIARSSVPVNLRMLIAPFIDWL